MSIPTSTRNAITLLGITLAACALSGCGQREEPKPTAPPAPAATVAPAARATPADLPRGLVLSLAQFVTKEGQSVPGPARLEFLYRSGGVWRTTSLEDPQSNVFHKAMLYPAADGPRLLTLGGTAAIVKAWKKDASGALEGTVLWQKDFGGKFSRMRDAEIADLYGDGKQDIAVATHDQGVVEVLRPRDGGFEPVELDRQRDIIVHEIEIGDLDHDGVPEVYATPSEPNRLEAGASQAGHVVRYVPAKKKGREVVADLGDRHAKEILVGDVDGDGTDELYVSVEGVLDAAKQLVQKVEIRRYDADTPPKGGAVIATIDDRLSRFLTAGDVDGDGKKELVAAAFSSGLWLLRPGADPKGAWKVESIDTDSAGFEHAAILCDLDGDGTDELYVASDKHKQVRRYTWDGHKLVREVIYARPDDRPIFTWNIMPIPRELIPSGG
ncbi:MAG TPA: VCBS repeat-containing protein [Myxococcota bacterium]|nr:VCBS repeat-containing protein [Myxococcota bacterium]